MKKENRVAFQVKLIPENYIKIKTESEKIGLTMSAFLSLLISNYKGIDVSFEENNKK